MAIPAELEFANEEAFVHEFLIPLLQRLGFSLVVDYHGTAEFGKDLVFAEVDRFGHVRYHGLQAKYEPSTSLNAVEALIADCKQAFENPFTHPQTGTIERISSFYAMTGGTIGPEATQHFFNSLLKLYGGNVRLLQAKDLLILDRWSASGARDRITGLLTGLLVELNYNARHIVPTVVQSLRQLATGVGTWPLWRLRADACSAYLRQPFMPDRLNVDLILNYWHLAVLCNREVDLVGQGIFSAEHRTALTAQAIKHLDELDQAGIRIRGTVQEVLRSLGPLSGM